MDTKNAKPEDKKHLSYSGYQTYVTCAHKYKLHYIDKLRAEFEPTHLIFGSATDKALNVVLEDPKNKKMKELALAAAAKELLRLFHEDVKLQESDYDNDIMTDLTNKKLLKRLRKVGYNGNDPGDLAAKLFMKVTMGETLSPNQITAVHYLVYFSLLEKIALIVDAFIEQVLIRIKKIVSVQTNVKRGILDFQAEFKGVDGTVTCDNKTSSRDYEADSVMMSVQLAGYGAETGAYIVFNKTVRKNRVKTCKVCGNNGTGKRHKTCDHEVDNVRCNGEWLETVSPEIIPQIIIDKIPARNREIVEEAYSQVEQQIATGIFPRNLTNCSKQFGRPCEYFGLCWKNDMTGLYKKESKK